MRIAATGKMFLVTLSFGFLTSTVLGQQPPPDLFVKRFGERRAHEVHPRLAAGRWHPCGNWLRRARQSIPQHQARLDVQPESLGGTDS